MPEPQDPREELPKQLAVSLSALLVIALVVAGVLGAVTWAATSFVGVGDDSTVATSEPTMFFPSPTPGSEQPADDASGEGEGDIDGTDGGPDGTKADGKRADGTKADKDKDRAKKRKRAGTIVLHARPKQAAPFQRVRLFGRYPGGNGTTLQVQRKQGRWVFFPTSATVQGGRFETWIQSGRSGVNQFRVVDQSTGTRSRPVEVRIRPRR